MKLTDMAIVIELFLICLLVVVHTKGNQSHSLLMNNIMYNNVMDGIVEDSLRAGYKSVDDDGKPVVDMDEVRKCFMAESSMYNCDGGWVLVYVDSDGFYSSASADGFMWSEKQPFLEGADTAHEDKVICLTEYFRDEYGINVSLPTNDGEAWTNTVGDYSLLAVSYNREKGIICFSGAMISKAQKKTAE